MRSTLGIFMLSATLGFLSSTADAGKSVSPLQVTVGAERTELLVGEPIKLAVKVQNVSDHSLSVVGIHEITQHNLEFTLLKIYHANGREELFGVAPVAFATDVSYDASYHGDTLPPGGMLLFNIYPNVTYPFASASQGVTRHAFEKPGTYTVKVAYYIPPYIQGLPPGPGEMVLSNAIELRVRKTSAEEKEILDAIRSGNGIANDYERGVFDERKLRSVIQKYPDSRLIPYAKFNLARSMAVRSPQDAQEMYRDILQNYPGFRDEEVHVQLGYAAINDRDWKLAVDTMTELLTRRPELQNTYEVAHRYMWAKDQSPEALRRWLQDRQAGKYPDLISAQ